MKWESSARCLDYGSDDRVSIPGRKMDFLSLPPSPDRLWDIPSLVSNGYSDFFPEGTAAGVHGSRVAFI